MTAERKAWVFGCGVWSVSPAEYEALWQRADWGVRFVNYGKRAETEWKAFYDGK
jgi:hypothetical protein